MPLYIIIGVTPFNTSFFIAFAFSLLKTVDDYQCVISTVKELYEFFDILDLKVIIINANLGIICAITEKFSLASHLLYL